MLKIEVGKLIVGFAGGGTKSRESRQRGRGQRGFVWPKRIGNQQER